MKRYDIDIEDSGGPWLSKPRLDITEQEDGEWVKWEDVKMKLERCDICDAPTGNAGKGEGSLYIEDKGPLCEECYEELLKQEKSNE